MTNSEERYRILGPIGTGGLGAVFKAVDLRMQRVVALKTLRVHPDARALARFMREAQAHAQLRHPNLVAIYDVGQSADSPYLALEFIEGRSLADLLREPGGLSIDSAGMIVQEAGAALSYIHSKGFIHGDIKPSNILIGDDGCVKLADLGLTRPAGESSLSDTGTVSGTPAYMSPEQLVGRDLDARSDVYALGVVLYQVLAGHLPFSGQTAGDLYDSMTTFIPPPPSATNPLVSADLDRVVMKAMARDPELRYSSVEHFLGDLTQTMSGFAALDSVMVDRYESRAGLPPCLDRQSAAQPVQRRPPALARRLAMVGIAVVLALFGVSAFFDGGRRLLPATTLLAVFSCWMLFRLSSAPPAPGPGGSPHSPDLDLHSPDPATREMMPVERLQKSLCRGPLANAWLLVLTGPLRGKQYPITHGVVVGRSSDAGISYPDDPLLSRRHARITMEEGRPYIEDLGSKSGTAVNGVLVSRQELFDRDEIRLGGLTLLFIKSASPENLTIEAKTRIRSFDSLWEDLLRSARHG